MTRGQRLSAKWRQRQLPLDFGRLSASSFTGQSKQWKSCTNQVEASCSCWEFQKSLKHSSWTTMFPVCDNTLFCQFLINVLLSVRSVQFNLSVVVRCVCNNCTYCQWLSATSNRQRDWRPSNMKTFEKNFLLTFSSNCNFKSIQNITNLSVTTYNP